MVCRLVTSIYEVVNIHSILDCREKGQDKTPLWIIYVTAMVQLCMVNNYMLFNACNQYINWLAKLEDHEQ